MGFPTMLNRKSLLSLLLSACILAPVPSFAAASPDYKTEAMASVDANAKLVQVMVDTVFSFGEPGFQEIRTSDYVQYPGQERLQDHQGRGRHADRLDRDLG
jgi:hypothetical protein